MKLLSVLLFHNDEDIVEDQIRYYHDLNKHDLIVFNHNSNDNTQNIINHFKDKILCIYNLNEKVIFADNKVHVNIYNILLNNYSNIDFKNITLSNDKYRNFNFSKEYDWISFPESDEFLEGPNRDKLFYEHLIDLDKKVCKIAYDNYVFWFTEKDNFNIKSPIERIKHYSILKKCGTRIYTWRGKDTICRGFGHGNRQDKSSEITRWKTRHYEIRSKEHMSKKLNDRKNVARGSINGHYTRMYNKFQNNKDYGIIDPLKLNYDNGRDELNDEEKIDWSIFH